MIGGTVLVVFVSLAGVLIAQNADSKTERARRFEVRGRVVDENDDAVQGVLIRVEAASSDVPLPAQRSQIFTDDRGAFKLSLGAGKYYILASPSQGMDNQREIHTDGTSGAPYGQTYYPSTANKAAAVPMVADADSDTSTLVIRLLRQPSVPLAASAPAGQDPASVEGVVINEVTGAPLPRVHVSLWNFDDGVHRDYGAMTNPDGTFSIRGMPAATYGILLNRAGFANPRACCTSVTLRSGEHRRDVKLPLSPSGAIAGRVLNSDGEPVEYAMVGARGGSGWQGSQTDSHGRFRISGLLPGIYRLDTSAPMSTHPPSFPPEIGADTAVPIHYIRSDYPGTVEVQSGSEAGGIEMRLARTPVVRVSGRVTGASQAADISLSVNNRFGGFSDIARADGTFAWWGLDPGEYIIRAWEGIGALDWGLDGARARNSALTTITVAGANVDNVELHIRPPSNISGRVEYETGEAQPYASERWLRLSAVDRNGVGAAALSADGHFTLKPLLPGRYRVMCDCGRPSYVKSIRLESSQIQGDVLDLSDGPERATLRVLVSSRFGEVSGTVQADRSAMAGLKVALVAFGRKDDGPTRFTSIDAGGRYLFDSVVPGEYKLVVLDVGDVLVQGLELSNPVIETVKVLAGESIIRNPGIVSGLPTIRTEDRR